MRYSYPVIPTLCQCGCNEILWHRGQRFISGHDSKAGVARVGKKHSDNTKEKMRQTKRKNMMLHPEFYHTHFSENGKKTQKLHPGIGSRNLKKKSKLLYNNEIFLSKHEIECYKFLESFNFVPNVDFFHDYAVGTKQIDFYIPRLNMFWEHHPLLPYHKISLEEYWCKRAEILKQAGYTNSCLIVTKDLSELNIIKGLILNESIVV